MFPVLLEAARPLRLCIYGDNRGAGPVHRELLRQSLTVQPRAYVAVGDLLKFDYGWLGSPAAVLNDYRTVLATPRNSLQLWPEAPGPVLLTVVGGDDEQFFLNPDVAALADTSRAGRFAYEGTNELGVRLYDEFELEQMRLRIQPLADLPEPLPMSAFGDYLLHVGTGSRRDCALLILYRPDRWGFRPQQLEWVDSVLAGFRKTTPRLPLLVFAHDWTWHWPDTLDDGRLDGASNSVRGTSPAVDADQKRRLGSLLQKYRADIAVAADRGAYRADPTGPLLRINTAAAQCTDYDGKRVAADNVWLEYMQTDTVLQIIAHSIDPPIGCGLRPEAAAFGTVFEKRRTAGAVWRRINP